MHIPHGVLSPTTAIVTEVLGAAGLGAGLWALRGKERDRTTARMGMTGAFLFAAQMVNFQLYPLPISGHLLGGVLASVILGPWAGSVVIAAVLIVQCLLFGDGGLDALGANFINMGLIGSVVGRAIYAPLRRAIGGRRGVLLASMAAAWVTVILGATAFAIEFAASGHFQEFVPVLGWMLLVHAGIGVGEALITGGIVRFVLLSRPELLDDETTAAEAAQTPVRRHLQAAVAGLAVACAVAIFLAPFASRFDDGLEWVGQKTGLIEEKPSPIRAPIPDYEFPGVPRYATAAAGLVGTLVVFGVGMALARVFARPIEAAVKEGTPSHAT